MNRPTIPVAAMSAAEQAEDAKLIRATRPYKEHRVSLQEDTCNGCGEILEACTCVWETYLCSVCRGTCEIEGKECPECRGTGFNERGREFVATRSQEKK